MNVTTGAIGRRPETVNVPTIKEKDALYLKITWRLIPFLFACYVLSYLDRVNVGFAKLQMLGDLQMSNAAYGLGAGIFFIGYFLFEVPSNLILHRVGARRWIARIMVTWGLLSAAMAYTTGPLSFYAIRFLLGVAEAGFFPGIILYLTYWFPADRRGRVVAMFLAAIPVAGVIGGPLSGAIMTYADQSAGLRGWQWMFLIEGLPTVVMGVVTWFYLTDGVSGAHWLSAKEKAMVSRDIENDDKIKAEISIKAGLTGSKVILLCAVYFSLLMGLYGLSFWLPTIISTAGVKSPLNVGLLTAIPYGLSVVAMLFASRHSDVKRERRWHLAIAALMGAIGLIGSVLAGNNVVLALVAFSFATMGIMSTLPLFWTLPTAFLGGLGAAAGIAFITSVGNLAGFVGSYAIGWLKEATSDTGSGMYMLAAFLVLAAVLVLRIPSRVVDK
jgi:D-galactonate transporter